MGTLNDTRWERLMVMMKVPDDQAAIKHLINDLKTSFTAAQSSSIRIINYFDNVATNDEVDNILDVIFNVIIMVTMFLCFFSLCSSMSANLLDQTKEIGILRAIGFTSSRIIFLYFYEAFILVMASCALGVMIGVIVGYTMVLQQAVFTDMPLAFYFPWSQFLFIMLASIFCAFASTYGPTSALLKDDIANIFRKV